MLHFASPSQDWPTQHLARIQVYVFRVPIETPVATSFGVMLDRPALLLRVEDADGACGWGEAWVNFPGCGAEHRARLIDTALAPLVLGRTFRHPRDLFAALSADLHLLGVQAGEPGPVAQIIAALDIAVWDLLGHKLDRPLRTLLTLDAPSAVPAYASGIHPDQLDARIESSRALGLRAFKMKIGFGAERDMPAVQRLLALRGDGDAVMLDANQAWDLGSARDMLQKLEGPGFAWLEEPMAADRPWSEWRELAQHASVPLAGGENLRGQDAFDAALASAALAVLQPDMCKWGGFSGCLPVARKVIAAGRRYCPHFLGAGIGLMASAQLLAAAGGDGLLEVDVNPNPLRNTLAQPTPPIVDGHFRFTDAPGLGVQPDLHASAPWQVLHIERHAGTR